jgi:hypothetical protein
MRAYLAYLEACFIKVVDIIIQDTMLSNYVLHEPKLPFNNLRIFIQGSLIVIPLIDA